MVLIWGVFSVRNLVALDPDFGWHLRTGEWIWQNQAIPKTDLFSYTMPDYSLSYPGWLAEVIIYRLYQKVGYLGLSVFFGLAGMLIFLILIPANSVNFALVPVILLAKALLGYISIRPATLSFLLAAIFFGILRKSLNKPRLLLILPAIFLLWANLHGGFFIGLAILTLSILIELFLIVRGKKKPSLYLKLAFCSLFFSLLATSINPYGWRIYQEVFLTLFSQELHFQISEWLPYANFDLSMFIYTGVLVSFGILQQRGLSLFEKITSGLLLLGGLSSRRLIGYFFIFTLPIFTSLTREFYFQVYRLRNFKKLWRKRRFFSVAFCLFVCFSFWSGFKDLKKMREERYYPERAIEFIRQQNLSSNLFSSYNWGGYLIWKLPEKKVFVDGRMAIWKQNGYSAFKESGQILTGVKDYRPVFDRYSIEAVLLPVEKESNRRSKEALFSLNRQLAQDGWQLVYEDGIAQVFVWPGKERNY
jgi:hypothetical protein